MRLPSVIVKKGKVVLVVVATWEQQNISWKHHCIENSENIIGTIILHQLKKLIEKISSNPNGWQGIWSTTIETDREFFSLNCSVHCTTDSVRCAADFWKLRKKISWNHGATVKCCQLSKWSESSNSDTVKIKNQYWSALQTEPFAKKTINNTPGKDNKKFVKKAVWHKKSINVAIPFMEF